jgi:hypothetical protein
MIRNIFAITFVFLISVSYAQQSSSSPYSLYGIGEVKFRGTAEYSAMAGVAVEQDSIHINLENPASFSGIKLTTFSVGGSYKSTNLKTADASSKAVRSTIDYFAVAIPISKFGVSMGLIPYSAVGYKVETESEFDSGSDFNTTITDRYYASGGINKLYFGLGYQLNKDLSVGADLNYNFGTVETINSQLIEDVSSGTLENHVSKFSGLNYSIGALYQKKLYKDINLYSSFTYAFESRLKSINSANIETSTSSEDLAVASRYLPIASKTSVAVGVGVTRKWMVGAKYSYRAMTDLSNSYNEDTGVDATYGNYSSFSLGGYFIPNYNSYSSYFKKVVYRFGLKHEKSGLLINSQSIDNQAASFGLGMPFSGTFSNLNINFEVGKRGTTTNNLIQENYSTLTIGLTFNDKWFQQRKID